MQYLYFTMNEQSGLTDLLVKKYHFFDKNGMNINAINEFLTAGTKQQIPIILQHKQEQQLAQQTQKQAEARQKQIVGNMNIRVFNGKIELSKGEPAGSFVPAPNPNGTISPDNPILVMDEANNVIARVIACKDFNATVVTYDKNTFEVKSTNRYDKNYLDIYYSGIAETLAMNEYLKGQHNSYLVQKAEYNQMEKERTEAREADRKEKTEVQGVLTLKDGTKVSGAFRFEYRQTPEGRIAREGSINDLDAGKIIYYLYQDEKGKNKIKIYNVKDASTFYINDGEVYDAVTYKSGNRMKDAMAGGSLDVGKMLGGNKTQKFLLRLAVTDKARLYFYAGEYILMKSGSEDAIVGKTFNTDDLAKFASDCPTVSQKVSNNDYNNGGDSYKQLVEDYTKCN